MESETFRAKRSIVEYFAVSPKDMPNLGPSDNLFQIMNCSYKHFLIEKDFKIFQLFSQFPYSQRKDSKCSQQIPIGGSPGPFRVCMCPQDKNYFHNTTKTSPAPAFTVLTYTLMVKKQRWEKLVVPNQSRGNKLY